MSERLSGSLQENILVLLCWSDKSFHLVRNSVSPNLFSTEVFREIVTRVYEFIDSHKKPPKDHLPDLLEDLFKDKKSGGLYKDVVQGVRAVRKTINEEYILSQLEKFVRQQKLKLGIIKAGEALQAGDDDEAEIALQTCLKERLVTFDPGMTLDQALTNIITGHGVRDALPLGIPELDRHHLGPAKKEIHSLLAPKKAGKTWWLIHLAKRALLVNWKVAVFTLEVGEQLYNTRILQGIFSLTIDKAMRVPVTRFEKDSLGRITTYKQDMVDRGSLSDPDIQKVLKKKALLHRFSKNMRVKEFPTGLATPQMLFAYLDSLERLENFIPDLIIVDYPKLMKHSAENLRIELGITIERLRGMGKERNCAVAIVGQSNREGVKAGTTKGIHAAEDFSITQTSDVVLTFSQTPAEYQLGLARLGVDSSRISRQFMDTIISQSYDIGQFCLDSAPLISTYMDEIAKLAKSIEGKANEEEDD